MFKQNFLRLFLVLGILIFIFIFIFYRLGFYSEQEEVFDVPPITEENSIHFFEALDNVGEEFWVFGTVDHVFVSANDNYFVNFCSDFRECPFSSVVFSEYSHLFKDIESWFGQDIYIYGKIKTYEGRSQIIIKDPKQVNLKEKIEPESSYKEGVFEVVNVIDGDTIWVRVDGSVKPVRLIGIDAPEIEGPYSDEECFGPEAKDYLESVLEEGAVVLEKDDKVSDRDKYERILRYVYLPDGELVNSLMVEEGYALVYEVETFKKMEKFLNLEEKARLDEIGMWALCENLLE